jgi:hypothetical protein
MQRFDFLVDYNLRGQAKRLCQTIQSEGWVKLLADLQGDIHFIQFEEVNLPENCSDFHLWTFAQSQQMIILTADRRTKDGTASLEYVISQNNTLDSLPVITVSNKERMRDKSYRLSCAAKLIEICLDLGNCLGVGRLYIP